MRRGCSMAPFMARAMPADAAGGAEPPQRGNVRGPNRAGSRGDATQGFAQADVVVEGEFRTQVQTHCCLETHAVVADWRPDMLTVYLSTQYAAGVRNELASAFGLPRSRVRVIVEAMGGGFGSKSSAGNYVRAAVALSRMAHAPVRLVLDRDEEQLDSGNRPATVQRLADRRDAGWAPDRDSRVEEYGTAGVALGCGRRQHRRSDVRMPQLRDRPARRVHQRRPGIARCARPATFRAPSRSSR